MSDMFLLNICYKILDIMILSMEIDEKKKESKRKARKQENRRKFVIPNL